MNTQGGYSIGPLVFCETCALGVTDEQGRAPVWKDEHGDIHSCSEDVSDYVRSIAPSNAILYPEGYNDAFPVDNEGNDGDPFKCFECGKEL